jgi:hypothetical protein
VKDSTLDDVRIYNRALSASEIAAPANLADDRDPPKLSVKRVGNEILVEFEGIFESADAVTAQFSAVAGTTSPHEVMLPPADKKASIGRETE